MKRPAYSSQHHGSPRRFQPMQRNKEPRTAPMKPAPPVEDALPPLPATEYDACGRLIDRLTQLHFDAEFNTLDEYLLLLELGGAYARQDALPGVIAPPLEPHPRLAEARALRTAKAAA